MISITGAKVIVTCPGRNFVTLKIETDQGISGLGDATLNGRELSVASYLTDHVIPCLIGRDAHRIEDIWQYLCRGAIKGKVANLPLYQLLGGACRDGAMVYAYTYADGMLHPGEAPGLGVDIDEALAAKYPYQRAYLPVNRLEDGSMYNW